MSTVEEILAEEKRQLASALLTEAGIHAAPAIVHETSGTIKAPDRETLITLAEDEEFMGTD